MKKGLIFTILISIVVVTFIFLGACAKPAPSTTTPAPQQTSTPAPQVFKLKYASDIPEVAAPSKWAIHFMDYVEKESGGRVVFERFHGGVLGIMPEMLNLVSTGAIDTTLMMHVIFKEKLPMHNFPEDVAGTQEFALDYFNRLNYEIPETAAIMEAEMKQNNIVGLNYHALGEDGLGATIPFKSLADLKGKKVGADKEQKALTSMGLNQINVNQADMYEGLARGVFDVIPFTPEAMVSNKWYEHCKTYMLNGMTHCGFETVVNLNTWNKLPADIQKIFKEAAKSSQAFSLEWDKTNTEKYLQVMRDAGLTVGRLPAEDSTAFLNISNEMDVQDMLNFAGKVDKTKEAETILKYANQILFSK